MVDSRTSRCRSTSDWIMSCPNDRICASADQGSECSLHALREMNGGDDTGAVRASRAIAVSRANGRFEVPGGTPCTRSLDRPSHSSGICTAQGARHACTWGNRLAPCAMRLLQDMKRPWRTPGESASSLAETITKIALHAEDGEVLYRGTLAAHAASKPGESLLDDAIQRGYREPEAYLHRARSEMIGETQKAPARCNQRAAIPQPSATSRDGGGTPDPRFGCERHSASGSLLPGCWKIESGSGGLPRDVPVRLSLRTWWTTRAWRRRTGQGFEAP